MRHDLVVLFEHPEWQKPLFAALERRGVRFGRYDLKQAAFDPAGLPEAPLYFNQASPNSNLRAPIARAFGFDPFERVVNFLVGCANELGCQAAG